MRRELPLTAALVAGATIAVSPQAGWAQEMPDPVTAESIEWAPAPEMLPEGAEIAVLAGNPAEGFHIMRVRLPDGTEVPPHWESEVGHVTVVEGTFHLGEGETFDRDATTPVPAGGFFSMPVGVRHFAWAEGTTVLEVVRTGPSELHILE